MRESSASIIVFPIWFLSFTSYRSIVIRHQQQEATPYTVDQTRHYALGSSRLALVDRVLNSFMSYGLMS